MSVLCKFLDRNSIFAATISAFFYLPAAASLRSAKTTTTTDRPTQRLVSPRSDFHHRFPVLRSLLARSSVRPHSLHFSNSIRSGKIVLFSALLCKLKVNSAQFYSNVLCSILIYCTVVFSITKRFHSYTMSNFSRVTVVYLYRAFPDFQNSKYCKRIRIMLLLLLPLLASRIITAHRSPVSWRAHAYIHAFNKREFQFTATASTTAYVCVCAGMGYSSSQSQQCTRRVLPLLDRVCLRPVSAEIRMVSESCSPSSANCRLW